MPRTWALRHGTCPVGSQVERGGASVDDPVSPQGWPFVCVCRQVVMRVDVWTSLVAEDMPNEPLARPRFVS